MAEIMYRPEDVGKEVESKNRIITLRKYHLTTKEMIKKRKLWELEIKNVDKDIRKKAGSIFFNPYRKGIYYYEIQTLFLLGANDWHNLSNILKKIEQIMSSIILKGPNRNAWEKFRNKVGKYNAIRCKDYVGRIQENMFFFQRLGKRHPHGYKLYQVYSAVDIKRVSRINLPNGLFYYRLSTYKIKKNAFPIRDYNSFNFPLNERKFINNRFIGTILSHNETIKLGVMT